MSHRLVVPPLPIETRSVLYDITRLVRNIDQPFATGIDRIDLSIALDLAARFNERCSFVHAAMGGAAMLPGKVGLAVLGHLDAVWHEGRSSVRPSLHGAVLGGRLAGALRTRGVDPDSTTYVVASHTGLFRHAGALDHLDPLGKMRRIVYLHDLIPLEFPQYQTPDAVLRFKTFLGHALAYRVQVVTNTRDTAARVQAHIKAGGLQQIPEPIVCRPVLADAETVDAVPPPDARLERVFQNGRPVFVMLGTIEPRKNHLLILKVWQELSKQDAPPHLLILGKRGWMCDAPVDVLDNDADLENHVWEIGDLNDSAVVAVLRRARRLLFPSFAEGLGLPVLEAAAAGLPVISSDLAAVREIAGPGTVYLDPEDKAGWIDAIRSAAA